MEKDREPKMTAFQQLMYFEGGDALTYSPEEWAKIVTDTMNQQINDPFVTFIYGPPHFVHVGLTLDGAQQLAQFLDVPSYFEDVEIGAIPLSEDPQEHDYMYGVTFTTNLGDEDIPFEMERKQLEGMEKIEKFVENCKGAGLLVNTDDEDEIENGQRLYLVYELNFIFVRDPKEHRMNVFTDTPMCQEILKEYYEEPSLGRNIIRILANYLNYLLTYDLLSEVDGYVEA